MKKIILLLTCALLISTMLVACGERTNPIATITMSDGGIIEIELYYDVAPNTVLNFVALANDGFYDGLIFHRVSPTFMIQGGCPNGDGRGGPGYVIACETEDNPSHDRGVLSMAHAGLDTGGSQFFIMTGNAPHLDGGHTAFGRVLEGMDVVDRIASQPGTPNMGMFGSDGTYSPTDPMYIVSIEIETHGQTFRRPATIRDNSQ